MRARTVLAAGLWILAPAFLAACGGAGGSATNVVPTTQTTPTPTPTPTPQPVSFDTPEFRRSNGLDNINAIAAYEEGGTGDGVIIAVVDSGIDQLGSEFAGRIHPASTNTANPGSSIQDIDGHGTFVSSVAAGAKDDVGTHGVAFDAQILALRTDSGTSCQSVDGCSHFDSDIAEALDVARVEGAKVANLSLGGGGAAFSLRQATDRATSDGVILVISAGNDGQTQPDDFALLALDQRANGRVLIAGYVDDNNVIDPNSNRAGSAQDVFVVAPGSDIRATGLNGDEFFVTGSSFAAPHVSGAIAVLYSLFPNLTADEMIELITSTATDLGAVGVDAVYGHGLINLEEAIQPQGQMQTALSSAGDTGAMGALVSTVSTPSAFGNAVSLGLSDVRAIGLDRFDRAYDVPLAQFAQTARPEISVGALFDTRERISQSTLQNGSGSLRAQFGVRQEAPLSPELLASFSGAFADRADVRQVTAQMHLDLGRARISSFVNQRPGAGLSDQTIQPTLSLMDTDASQYGLGSAPAALRLAADYALRGGWRVGLMAARNDAQPIGQAFGQNEAASLTQSAVTLAWHGERFAVRSAAGVIEERGQVFGAAADRGALSLGTGTQTRFAQLAMQVGLSARWRFDADIAYGSATLNAAGLESLLAPAGNLGLSSWTAQMTGTGLFAARDALAFTVRQPQRVESGSAQLANLPTITAASGFVSLVPDGRQIDFEAAYRIDLSGFASLSGNVLMRQDSGHIAGQNDAAGLVRLTSRF